MSDVVEQYTIRPWLAGFLVAGGLYYLLTPRGDTPSAAAGQPTAEVGAG